MVLLYRIIKTDKKIITAITATVILVMCMFIVFSHSEPYKPASMVQKAEKTLILPAIMYHSVLKDTAMHGEYVISPAELEKDLKFINDHGYTCVTPEDLIAYTNNNLELPKKPIMLTFDDGYYNNYLYVYPLLKKYGCKAVISVIGTYTQQYSDNPEENAYYSHCTWDNLKEMLNSGLVEVANHSYNMHKSGGERLGTKINNGENQEKYKDMLRDDIATLQEAFEHNLEIKNHTFVYPFGAYDDSEDDFIASLGYKCTITCNEKLNYITKSPESLFRLGRFIRPSGTSLEDIFQKNNLC